MASGRTAEDSQLKFRISQSLRTQLEEAAHKNGRSLNAEISERLQRSLDASKLNENWTPDEIANDLAAVAMQAIYIAGPKAAALSTKTSQSSTDWFHNSYAYEQVCRAVAKILDGFRPPGPTAIQEFAPTLTSIFGFSNDQEPIASAILPVFDRVGEAFAQTVLNEVSANSDDPERSPERPNWIARAQRLFALRQSLNEVEKGAPR